VLVVVVVVAVVVVVVLVMVEEVDVAERGDSLSTNTEALEFAVFSVPV
jgi:hypothetical protein